MEMIKQSCEQFLAELAGKAPTPGGGGTAALVGAAGVALGSMVGSLTIGKKKVMAVIKDIQFHPVEEKILHMDFLEVTEKKPVVMEVPVSLEGHSEGVKAGGKLSLEMRKLKVKAVYTHIPEKMVINVDNLGLGKTMQVGDLHFDGLEIMNAKNAVVCAVKLTRAARGAAAKAE